MKKLNLVFDKSSNNIPYIRFGNGLRTLLLFHGGPGNILPEKSGFGLKMLIKDFIPLSDDYRITLLVRKIGLKEGDNTETMAADYAEMIKQDYNGHADAILGCSYGGLIAQHFAADYPDLWEKLIIVGATNKVTAQGIEIDEKFTKFLIEGNTSKAFSTIYVVIQKNKIIRFFMKVFLRIFGFFMKAPTYPEFSKDILIELEAEKNHDASKKFPKISKPVLIIIGDEDFYFTKESAIDMNKQIPNSLLKIYEKTGHNITSHPNFLKDIKQYLELD